MNVYVTRKGFTLWKATDVTVKNKINELTPFVQWTEKLTNAPINLDSNILKFSARQFMLYKFFYINYQAMV